MTTSTHETEITADPDVPLVRTTRAFDAPPAKVFRAHTDPELVVQWNGPRGTEMRIDHFDCRTGGSYRYLHVSDGNEFGFRGCFHEVRPSELIVQTFTFEVAPASRRPHWSTTSRAATPFSSAAWRTASVRATSASTNCSPADHVAQ